MSKLSLSSLDKTDLEGKKVLVRVDFNVPLNESGEITDDTRIRAAMPTIEYLVNHSAKVILAAHFGRPKGQVNEKMRLTPVSSRLSDLEDELDHLKSLFWFFKMIFIKGILLPYSSV